MKRLDMRGQRFGRLLVIANEPSVRQPNGEARAVCRVACDCGRTAMVRGADLRSGATQSCGCLHRGANMTHGRSNSDPTYQCWKKMRQRCHSKSDKDYSYYGGRGISVCARWNSFENFLADMGEATKGLRIDRVDNDGNYEPNNCRWATPTEQARNRRSNHMVTINDETLCITEWATRYGINVKVVRSRIGRLKWGAIRAITTPLLLIHRKPHRVRTAVQQHEREYEGRDE